jgi:hypothetical protein
MRSKLKFWLVIGPVLALGAATAIAIVLGVIWIVATNIGARREARRQWEQEHAERVKIADEARAAKQTQPAKTPAAAPPRNTPASLSPRPQDARNRIKNPSFAGFESWRQFHISKTPDKHSLTEAGGVVTWERTQSGHENGLVGIEQQLDIDVRNANRVVLSLEALVEYQTLYAPPLWLSNLNYPSQLPVHVAVLYDDRRGHPYRWDYGFTIHEGADGVLELDGKTQVYQYKPGKAPLPNATPVPQGKWCRVSIDILEHADPRPVKIAGLLLYGNGFDFKGAVRNVRLEVE